MFDSKGKEIHVNDKVHNRYGYDLIVKHDPDGEYYGNLIDENDKVNKRVRYALNPKDITKYE